MNQLEQKLRHGLCWMAVVVLSHGSDCSDGLGLPLQSSGSSKVLTCLKLLFCTYKWSGLCAQTGMAAYFTCEYMHSLSRELFPNICVTESFDFHCHWVDAHRTACAPEAVTQS